ncbi:hypothetical protein G7046_g2793 [Stylonectria norvegica]|nr:hypothetical protein G7046_g2793 [Stylonectria norvegica]
MSGLEAFGLACNVMQAIDFTQKIVLLGIDIYQGRTPDAELRINAEYLASLSKDLQSHWQALKPRTASERRLSEIAQKCSVAARDVTDEIDFLSRHQKAGDLAATLRVTVKVAWRKNRLKRLEKLLNETRTTLESQLLGRVCSKIDAQEIQNRRGFNKLGKDLQLFISKYTSGHTQLRDLITTGANTSLRYIQDETSRSEEVVKTHMTSELARSEKTITQHVTAQTNQAADTITKHVQRLNMQSVTEAQRERLLQSLEFPGMNERRNHVADAYESTFEWIWESYEDTSSNGYQNDDEYSHTQSSFAQHLAADGNENGISITSDYDNKGQVEHRIEGRSSVAGNSNASTDVEEGKEDRFSVAAESLDEVEWASEERHSVAYEIDNQSQVRYKPKNGSSMASDSDNKVHLEDRNQDRSSVVSGLDDGHQVGNGNEDKFSISADAGCSIVGDNDSENESQVKYETEDSFSVATDSEWVDAPDLDLWDDFNDWLKSDSNIYWISGKPGSGKSTLVGYLISCAKTTEALHVWREDASILAHFLWKPGSMMQNNIKGLLLSLTYQALAQKESALVLALEMLKSPFLPKSHTDWSTKNIKSLCYSVFQAYPSSLCIFVDGLDEVCEEDGEVALVGLISELRELPNVKVCVASRPEPCLQRLLGRHPQLRLQDLTAMDMHRYATESLKPYWQLCGISRLTHSDIIPQLMYKAGGVFLWLHIVVRRLIRDLLAGFSKEDILKRIDAFPTELSELYLDIWARLGSESQKKAAIYLNLILTARNLDFFFSKNTGHISVLELAPTFDVLQQVQWAVGERSLLGQLCAKVETDIETRCAGLLEIIWDPSSIADQITATFARFHMRGAPESYLSKRVAFIHRSAYDFLVDTEEGRRMRRGDPSSKEGRVVQLAKSVAIARLYLSSDPKQPYFDKLDPLTFGEYRLHIIYSLAEIRDTSLENEVRTVLSLLWSIHHPIDEYRFRFLAFASIPAFKDFVLSCIAEHHNPKEAVTYVLRYMWNFSYFPEALTAERAEAFLAPLLSFMLGADWGQALCCFLQNAVSNGVRAGDLSPATITILQDARPKVEKRIPLHAMFKPDFRGKLHIWHGPSLLVVEVGVPNGTLQVDLVASSSFLLAIVSEPDLQSWWASNTSRFYHFLRIRTLSFSKQDTDLGRRAKYSLKGEDIGDELLELLAKWLVFYRENVTPEGLAAEVTRLYEHLESGISEGLISEDLYYRDDLTPREYADWCDSDTPT